MWKQVKILEYQSKMSLYLFQICRFRINRFSIDTLCRLFPHIR